MALWDEQAKKWALIGSPLKPSAADIAISSAWIKALAHSRLKPLHVLLLGVTPEIANIAWPQETKFFAIDNNLTMIKSILPSQTPTLKPVAIVGNWLQLPFASDSMDLVIGDGCYTMLSKDNYEQMTQEIWRVLHSTGTFIMRFFIRPDSTESLDAIKEDLILGKIANFHILKWRIAMALHGSLSQGVCLSNIWSCWAQHFKPNNQALFERLKWPNAVLHTIDNYKNNNTHYTFPTLAEMRRSFKSLFIEQAITHQAYGLAERCPIMKFSPIQKIRKSHEINSASVYARSNAIETN